MRYFFLIIIFLSNNAFADWEFISKNYSGNSFYLDKKTIEKNGTKKQFWIMLDLERPYKQVIWSFKRQLEFDCASKTTKGLYIIGFNQNLTKGQILMDGRINSEYTPIYPSSMESDLFRLVCD